MRINEPVTQRDMGMGNDSGIISVIDTDERFVCKDFLNRHYHGTDILLVEDKLIDRMIARFMLEDRGLAVDVAKDGIDAIKQIRKKDYALILINMQMSNMNGLDAIRKIRLLPRHDKTPILAMTTSAFAENKENCLAAGMNDFITKPLQPKLLDSTLLKWLSRNRTH